MRVFFVLAVAGAILLYSSGLWAPYHLDDASVLDSAKTLSWSPARFLGFATFWLNAQVSQVFGPIFPWREPFYFRLGNVLIHVIAATALFWLALELTGRRVVAAIAATLFLVHPIQTQAVTYITQRFESQAAMFMILSAAAYVRFRRTGGRLWFFAMLILEAAGGLTKQTAFVLPVWIVFIEIVFFAGGAELRKRLLYISAVGLVLLFPVWESLPNAFEGPTLKWIALDQYWVSQGPILTRYFQLSAWPEHQFLFYGFEPVRFFSWAVAAEWALVLMVLAAGLYCLRRWPLIGFGIVSFFILLLPVIILPLPDVINEHRYNAYYRQLGHLLTSVNLAAIYQAKGNLKLAKTEALRAVAANPAEPMAWQSLGNIQFQLGDYEGAQRSFGHLVVLQPNSESLRSFQVAATRLGNTSLTAAIGRLLDVEEQREHAEEKPPFTIPTRYRTYIIFALTLAALLGVASGLWTLWTACRTLLRQTAANS